MLSEKAIFSRWLNYDSGSRVFRLTINEDSGRPLRELGVVMAGEDQLSGRFRAGTPLSITHLAWFVTHGKLRCDYGGGYRTANAGSLFLCPARYPHYIEPATKQAAGVWFHLRDVPQWKHLHQTGPTIRLANELSTLTFLMGQFRAESRTPDSLSESIKLHVAELISLLLRRELSPSGDPERTAQIQRLNTVWKEVENHPEREWSTETLATQVGVSSSYLYKLIATYFGCSPMKMVLRLRMRRAESLLLHTDLSIESVAEEVGYQTAYAFSNAFLRHTQSRPGSYRSTARKRLAGLELSP